MGDVTKLLFVEAPMVIDIPDAWTCKRGESVSPYRSSLNWKRPFTLPIGVIDEFLHIYSGRYDNPNHGGEWRIQGKVVCQTRREVRIDLNTVSRASLSESAPRQDLFDVPRWEKKELSHISCLWPPLILAPQVRLELTTLRSTAQFPLEHTVKNNIKSQTLTPKNIRS